MNSNFYDVAGEAIPCNSLSIQRARDFALLIEDGVSPYVQLLDCRRTEGGKEAIVIEVQATIPQEPAVALRRTERLKVQFAPEDNWYPDVRASRLDFPRVCVLHLNLVPVTEPASLCLFTEPWDEVRLRLTANELLFRIQMWLNDSANGTLHREDQALEPAFMGRSTPLIISPRLIEAVMRGPTNLSLGIIQNGEQLTFIGRRQDRILTAQAAPALIIPLVSEPHEHCIINSQPETLDKLHHQLEPVGINLLEAVQTKLVELQSKNQLADFGFLILLLVLLRKRSESADPEPETVAFFCIGNHADQTGLTGLARSVGLTGVGDNTKRGQESNIMLMAVRYELTAERASLYSGNDDLNVSLVGIGAGALGSQVVMNAVRGGLTKWTIIDNDYLLPHNLVRHASSGVWLGHPKAKALAFDANALLDEATVHPIVADVLKPNDQIETIKQALQSSNAIVDLSASVAVARYLTLDVSATSKRCSLFVSPSGKDLVFLGEDAEREFRLDHIEVQYYRVISSDERLTNHLLGGSTIGSCRNITSRVPQHLMGLHAAQSVRTLRAWLQSDQARVTVVRSDDDSGEYTVVSVPLGRSVDVGTLGNWKVLTDQLFLDNIREQRGLHLPNETGGVLLAHVDVQRRTIYVCHQIPAPPDSERQPTMYIRGCAGLEDEYQRIQKATLNNLVYIGEWHSHPNSCQCLPSHEDIEAGSWLAEKTRTGSLPGIMLIVGEEEQTCWMLCSQTGAETPIHLFLTQGQPV